MVWSFVSLAVRSLFALVLLFGRSDRAKELEIASSARGLAAPLGPAANRAGACAFFCVSVGG
jgi:hypothetical protein